MSLSKGQLPPTTQTSCVTYGRSHWAWFLFTDLVSSVSPGTHSPFILFLQSMHGTCNALYGSFNSPTFHLSSYKEIGRGNSCGSSRATCLPRAPIERRGFWASHYQLNSWLHEEIKLFLQRHYVTSLWKYRLTQDTGNALPQLSQQLAKAAYHFLFLWCQPSRELRQFFSFYLYCGGLSL